MSIQPGVPHAPPDPFGGPIPLEQIRAGSGRRFAITTSAKALGQLLRFGTLLVLARLLAPADFGVLAMVTSAIGIAELFRDLGLSQATVRVATITRTQVNTLFWINVAFGALTTGLCLLAAPHLGRLLSDPRVGAVASAMSFTFLVNALAAQHLALLRRNLRFGEIAGIGLVAAVAGSVVALALAALGAAYWALVAAVIVTGALTAIGAWRASGWRPSAPAYDPTVRPMISFGGYLVGFGFLSYLAQNVHIVLIGRLFGAGAAGMYVRASTLLSQPLSYALDPLRMIVPPTLSRLQEHPQELREHYLSMLAPLMLAVAPFSLWLALLAQDVVRVLLGAQWHDAAGVLALLALGAVPQVMSNTSGWLFLARGDSRGMMNWGAMGWTAVILCMLAGLPWGMNGVAAMYSLSMFLIVAPCMHYACRGTRIRLIDLWGITWRPIFGALVAAAAMAAALPLMADWRALPRVALASALYATVYLGLLAALPAERARLLELWARLRRPAEPAP
ncbi:MAG TPA: lipopolysaccharide biosynthesis protein [Solimonas sp.]|nr:lipopolysaccharide biosynthesis protein [Solimonas sp.]